MAFITLRRSRGTRNYYLVESYRDEQGFSRKRTLCYLGREQDGTDSLEKAIRHWQAIAAAGQPPARAAKARQRLELLRRHAHEAARVVAQRQERQRQAEAAAVSRRRQAEEAEHWQAIEQLRRSPSAEQAQAAKRAYRTLAMRLHPDQGGSHEAFIRLQSAFERANAAWRRLAG